MPTVFCVLRSGGQYDAEWVAKLQRGVARHLSMPHRFACLSDAPVACERIPLLHNWPGWWAKICLFAPGVITGPTLYLDLDTCVVGNLDRLFSLPHSFAMLRGFGRRHYIGSGVMWFREPFTEVYERFLAGPPERLIEEYARNPGSPGAGRHGAFKAARGDQAFIADVAIERFGSLEAIPRLTDDLPGMIQLFGRFGGALPAGTSLVCFKGKNKPPDARGASWMREAWT